MSTTLGWIFWAIGIINIYLGLYFAWAKKYQDNHKKILMGWLLMIIGLMFNSIANEYGVSRTSISKWCKYYDLPYRKKDIQNS